MQDVLVLLQHLTENEETTIKLIIECLYDVGAVNFINKKVQNDSINQVTKTLAGMSKPIAKRYGYYWFKKNCPELIVNWLTRKVAFPAPKAKAVQQQEIVPKVEPAPISTEAPSPVAPTPQNQSEEASKSEESATFTNTAHPQEETPELSIAPSTTGSQKEQLQVMVSSVDDLAEPCAAHENAVDQLSSTSPIHETPGIQIKTANSETANDLIGTVESATPSEPDAPSENPPSSAALPTSQQAQALPTSETNALQTGQLKTPNKVLMESFKVTALPTPMEQKTTQIRRLKTQNKLLMGSLAGTILVGGLAIWQLHTTQESALQLRQSTPSSIVPASQSVE